ncbi:hypothetical protein AVEN_11211-1 [Araneus ventricosus]|uniref:Uncharacterized protein n=1 Tax=Araneus ventricosus TaxID=182803 RepID=A0A4Y2ITR0_ARAVE|nr:hypothetical protein AVEN_11211-1 [Araneus ventricosus]
MRISVKPVINIKESKRKTKVLARAEAVADDDLRNTVDKCHSDVPGTHEMPRDAASNVTGRFWYPRLSWETSLFPHVNNGNSDGSQPNQNRPLSLMVGKRVLQG